MQLIKTTKVGRKMSNILLIEEPNQLNLFNSAKRILKQKGHKGKVIVKSWNGMLTGIHGGKRLAKMIKREKIDFLFIHFSKFFPEDAQKIINTIKKDTNATIVVITNVNPELTFGVQKSLQKPFKVKEFLKIVMEDS